MATDVRAPESTTPPPDHPPALTPVELARWAWRQLTSMRTALILLFLLALAAIPGSVVPQEAVDSVRAGQWRQDHPTLAPIYEKLGLFSVYDSVWFSAIYILLMVSLVGCFIPRIRAYWRGLRAQPPAAPRHLSRLPGHTSYETDEEPAAVLERARAVLRSRRYRVAPASTGGSAVSAERGYLREAGNLLFHLSVLIVLAGFAIGGLWGYKGGVVIVTKDGFSNTLPQYDDFRAGSFFQPASLQPFSFTVDDFKLEFIREGREAGEARKFEADLTYRSSRDAPARSATVSVNHPLDIDGTDVFLLGHGYAPRFTVRNADGSVAWSGSVPFLPEDATFRSFGVVKVTDPEQADGGHRQIGLEGEFYPTYVKTKGDDSLPFSAFPDASNPVVSMVVYAGDLGLDKGAAQSVYSLDKRGLTMLRNAKGAPVRVDLRGGDTATLPDGLGTVTFDGLDRYVKLQVSHTPGQWVELTGMVLALLGLLGSLYIRPRRVWVRATREASRAGRTVVEVGGLDRRSGGDLGSELEDLTRRMRLTQEENP